jgi:hypothetical protein
LIILVFCLIFVAFVVCLILLGVVEATYYLWRLETYSSLFFTNKKTEGKPPVHDQPERGFIIWIHIFTLISQDRDIDPYKVPSGLVVVHHGLLGSIPRWE